jgi:hypothetical protein
MLAHLALYGLFFAVPLSGWAYSSAAGFPVVVFGVLPLPDFVPVDRALAETLKGLHKLCTLSLAALVLLHVAAALKHQFVDRDGLLQRMRPGPRLKPLPNLFKPPCPLEPSLSSPWPWRWPAPAMQPAFAQPRPATLQAAGSEIGFTTRQMGVPVEGTFGRFSARIALDPKQPQPAAWRWRSKPAARASAAPSSTPKCPSPPG